MLMGLTISTTVSIGSLIVLAAVALGTVHTTRRDDRYKIAAAERNEYRDRATRLEAELLIARADVERLAARPDLADVTDRLDSVIGSIDDLRHSIDVHADPSLDRRQRRAAPADAPRRRITDVEKL